VAKRTPIYDLHVRLGGRMVDFAGWELPVQYSSIVDEHRTVRQAAGLFDVSHLGRVELRGPGALETLQHLATNDASKLEVGRAQYSLLLNERGGIVDDIFVYRQPDSYLIVINAATSEKDIAWMRARLRDAELVDRTAEQATISLQGPAAVRLLQPLVDVDLSELRRNGHVDARVEGQPMLAARTGYTGERGIELFPPADQAAALFERLLALEGVKPCGLGARDTLRLEAGNRLYGQDMDDDTNPFEAGLGWVVDFEKYDFVGRDALLRVQEGGGPPRRLVGFETLERAVPRHGAAVYVDGQAAGVVTSGSFAPSLEKNIGFAFVPPPAAEPGTEIEVDIRGRPAAARVVETPFFKRPRAGSGAGPGRSP
jgi:aminomethyltransferase